MVQYNKIINILQSSGCNIVQAFNCLIGAENRCLLLIGHIVVVRYVVTRQCLIAKGAFQWSMNMINTLHSYLCV